jgi:hypothetical protein
MSRKYQIRDLTQGPSRYQDEVISAISDRSAELAGGPKALHELGRLAANSRDKGLLEEARFLATVSVAQIGAWTSRKRLIARPSLYLSVKGGYLEVLEAYALVLRAAVSIDLNDEKLAESDLTRYFALSLPPATSEKLTPFARQLLVISSGRQGHWIAAQNTAEEAVRSSRQRGDRAALARDLILLSEALLWNRHIDQAIGTLGEADSIAAEFRDVGLVAEVNRVRAKITTVQGRFGDALDYADLARDAYAKIEAHRLMKAMDTLKKDIQRRNNRSQ